MPEIRSLAAQFGQRGDAGWWREERLRLVEVSLVAGQLGESVSVYVCVCVPARLRQQAGMLCLPARWPCVGVSRSSARKLPCMVLPRMHLAAGVTHAGCRCGAAVQVEALLRQQADSSLQQQAEDEDGDAPWWAPFVSTLQAYCSGAGLVLLRAGVCGHGRRHCLLGAARGVVCRGGGLHSEPPHRPPLPHRLMRPHCTAPQRAAPTLPLARPACSG